MYFGRIKMKSLVCWWFFNVVLSTTDIGTDFFTFLKVLVNNRDARGEAG